MIITYEISYSDGYPQNRGNKDQCGSNALVWDLSFSPSFLGSFLSEFIQNVQPLSRALELFQLLPKN